MSFLFTVNNAPLNGYATVSLSIHPWIESAMTWMSLRDMTLSETSQSQQSKCCLTPLIGGKISDSRKRGTEWWLPGAEGRGDGELVSGSEF